MRRILVSLLLLGAPAARATVAVRAKDIASFYGERENSISGVGLVVGLDRTGDSRRNEVAIKALADRLRSYGFSMEVADISMRNVAMVAVSARLGVDRRAGSRLDVTVASTGDAASLEAGYLLATPLLGLDRRVYAVAEGPVVVGGYTAAAGGDSSRKNYGTTGRVIGGAVVEREVPSRLDLGTQDAVELVLRDPDFGTAASLADAIDAEFQSEVARARDAGTVVLSVPEEYRGSFPAFAKKVEGVEVEVDPPARVVVNERTGTVVMGAEVRIQAVAVAHGGLSIEVRRDTSVSQPAPFSRGQTAVVSEQRVAVQEEDGKLTMVEGVTMGELVAALNDLGVKPRDLIVILQAMRAAGALHAEIVTQ